MDHTICCCCTHKKEGKFVDHKSNWPAFFSCFCLVDKFVCALAPTHVNTIDRPMTEQNFRMFDQNVTLARNPNRKKKTTTTTRPGWTKRKQTNTKKRKRQWIFELFNAVWHFDFRDSLPLDFLLGLSNEILGCYFLFPFFGWQLEVFKWTWEENWFNQYFFLLAWKSSSFDKERIPTARMEYLLFPSFCRRFCPQVLMTFLGIFFQETKSFQSTSRDCWGEIESKCFSIIAEISTLPVQGCRLVTTDKKWQVSRKNLFGISCELG